ncbi:MAG: DUF3775 domain-containing protein [Pseudomonadota bacterium]
MALEIAPEKVAYVIIKARELDVKVGAWEDTDDDAAPYENEDADSILEDLSADPTHQEATEFIDNLNEDEKLHLVALAWIGRGTFDASDLDEAVQTARDEASNTTSSYLLGMPLLPDYLEEGLDKLGFSVGEIEDDVM